MRFETDLMAFIKDRRLRCVMGLHGGMTNTYGVVHRKRWGVKEEDRIAVADWIKIQRIRATVRLGELEEDNDSTEFGRDITEWVFEVDNPATEAHEDSTAHKREISKLSEPQRKSRRTKG
jgi:hypothetical protein